MSTREECEILDVMPPWCEYESDEDEDDEKEAPSGRGQDQGERSEDELFDETSKKDNNLYDHSSIISSRCSMKGLRRSRLIQHLDGMNTRIIM